MRHRRFSERGEERGSVAALSRELGFQSRETRDLLFALAGEFSTASRNDGDKIKLVCTVSVTITEQDY